MSNYAEQIAAFEARRSTNLAAMEDIMGNAASEGTTLDAAQQEEFDGLEADNEAIDSHLKRLRSLEKNAASKATPVNGVKSADDGGRARAGIVLKKEEKLAPGINFARLAKCKAISKLDSEPAREIAKRLYGEDSAVYGFLQKAAVDAGTSASGNWGEHLVGTESTIFADFAEYLRPMTILGKFGVGNVPGLRRVPFRTALVGQTGGGTGYWVGEGKPKPLTSFDFTRTTLAPLKVANIAVVSMEILRDSSPSAEPIIRDSLAAALSARMDTDFIDPSKAASAGVSPASITHGVTPITSGGNDANDVREDIRQVFNTFIAANNAPTSGVWIMPATVALSLSLMLNPLGQPEFPGISMNGGMLFGLPVIVSEYVPTVSAGSYVALVNAKDIYEADDGGIMVDMSNEASLEMKDSGLSQDATAGTGTSLVSLWQTNSVGFRAERTINWAARRTSAVALIQNVNWGIPPYSGF